MLVQLELEQLELEQLVLVFQQLVLVFQQLVLELRPQLGQGRQHHLRLLQARRQQGQFDQLLQLSSAKFRQLAMESLYQLCR
jgi:hypothetical protein